MYRIPISPHDLIKLDILNSVKVPDNLAPTEHLNALAVSFCREVGVGCAGISCPDCCLDLRRFKGMSVLQKKEVLHKVLNNKGV